MTWTRENKTERERERKDRECVRGCVYVCKDEGEGGWGYLYQHSESSRFSHKSQLIVIPINL